MDAVAADQESVIRLDSSFREVGTDDFGADQSIIFIVDAVGT